MSYEKITFTEENGVAIMTLNQPDSMNALSRAMMIEMKTAIRSLNVPGATAKCLLLTGAGRAFCSGAELNPAAREADAGESLIDYYNAVLQELNILNIPFVSAINGVAAGAGMSFAIAADVAIASKSAYFLQAFVNIGLIPDAGSTHMLPRLIGKARAQAMMILGEKVSAEKAEQWGMIYKVVDDKNLMEEALRVAKKFADGPTLALSSMRKLMQSSATNTLEAQILAEAVEQRKLGYTADVREGITAFVEKRKANFTGK